MTAHNRLAEFGELSVGEARLLDRIRGLEVDADKHLRTSDADSEDGSHELFEIRSKFVEALVSGALVPHEEWVARDLLLDRVLLKDRLDIDDIVFPFPIVVTGGELRAGIQLRRSTLAQLIFADVSIDAGHSALALDLESATISAHAQFFNCALRGGMKLYQTTIGGSFFASGRVARGALSEADSTWEALDAQDLTVRKGFEWSSRAAGGLGLIGAEIGSNLAINGEIVSRGASAVCADGLRVGMHLIFGGTFDGGTQVEPAISIRGAQIGGELSFTKDSQVTNRSGGAVSASQSTCAYTARFHGSIVAEGTALDLAGASVGDDLIVRSSPRAIESASAEALVLNGAEVQGNLYVGGSLRGRFSDATENSPERPRYAILDAISIRVGGNFTLSATVTDTGAGTVAPGAVISADRASVGQSMTISGSARTKGGSAVFRMMNAEIGRQFVMTKFTSRSSVCDREIARVDFTGSKFCGDWESNALIAVGRPSDGQPDEHSAPALRLSRVVVAGNLVWCGEVAMEVGNHQLRSDSVLDFGAVQIGASATIGGSFVLNSISGSEVHANSTAEPDPMPFTLLNMQGGKVVGELALARGMSALQGASVDLSGLAVSGRLLLDTAQHSAQTRSTKAGQQSLPLLRLDGFSYGQSPVHGEGHDLASMEKADWWRDVLSTRTAEHSPSPWKQAASIWAAEGDSEAAVHLLIAQRRDRRKRSLASRFDKFVDWVLDASTGYGYRISRLWSAIACWSLCAVVLALCANLIPSVWQVGISDTASAPLVAVTAGALEPLRECSVVERIGMGLGWAIPPLALPAASACQLNAVAPIGQVVTAAAWVFTIVGSAMLALVIVSYTSIVRSPVGT